MATRFYFPSTGAAAVSPAFMAWTSTIWGIQRKCVTTRINSGSYWLAMAAASGAAAETILGVQYVSDPLAAQTISGTVKGQIRASEDTTAMNATLAVGIQVCSNDGSTIRGTLLNISASDDTATTPPELAITSINRRFLDVNESAALTLTSLAIQDGDRLIIEIGVREVTTNTARTATFNLLDNNSIDLPEDDTTTAAYNPWIEFSNTVSYQGAAFTPKIMVF